MITVIGATTSNPYFAINPAIRSRCHLLEVKPLTSGDVETAIRKAISIGGDSDTIACMTGGIAEAYYKYIPEKIMSEGSRFIDTGFKKVISDFTEKYE